MKISIYSVLTRCFNANRYLLFKYVAFFFFFFVSQQVFPQVSITSFSPTSAAMGDTVTITGTNFTGAGTVSFGGINAISFTVVNSTRITAVVPYTISGSVNVVNGGQTATKANFYYLPLSGIITDFAGYWATTTLSNNPVLPDNSHSLLAFTYNGINYSTGVNNSILTGQGINYAPGNFKSLPVANIAGTNSGSSIFLAMASKVDGNASVANASALAGSTVKDVMTDGPNGLNMGTGITNLPTSAIMTFEINIIHPDRIADEEPDVIITQIAQPTGINDVFQFVDASGNVVGNSITQNMLLLPKLGTYTLDLFNLSPGAPFNAAICFSAVTPNGVNTTREIRMVGFKLSDFGITPGNYLQVAALKVTPSGTSDYAFIAYSDAIEMSPNISQNLERTNSSICTGGTANLEVITSPAYGGTLTYAWEESIDAGSTWSGVTNIGNYSGATTNRLTIVSATNNYLYRATVTESGTNYSATCSPFTITVITPATPTGVSLAATALTTCLNNLVSLSGTASGGSNYFYQWETNALGSFVNIPSAILRTYLPPVNATGVISYRLRVSSGSGCSGSFTSAPVVISVVGIASITNASRCGTGDVSLTATATSGIISWYTASTGGALLATGGTYTASISATTTYYVTTDVSQCNTGARVPVTATIGTITWAGTNTSEWGTLSNWDCGGTPPASLPTSTSNITIPTFPTGGNFPVITTTAYIYNITVSPGAIITVDSGGVFEIYGVISNSGTLTATKGTILMHGAAQQTIPANAFSSNTIKNLTVNNTAGVLLGGELNLTGTYTPFAGLLTTFGYLTLKSDSNGTARVAQGTGVYISGNVNVERYMPARRSWRLMTAPLTNSNTIYQSWQNNGVYSPGKGMLVTAPGGGNGIDSSGNTSLRTWNNTNQLLKTVTDTKVKISSLTNGSADNTGYFIFVRGDRDPYNIDHNGIRTNITTLTSTGYLQTGTQNFTGLSAATGGFSLIGNPYASPVDWDRVRGNSGTTNIKRKFYVWDPRLNLVGGYVAMDDVLTGGVFLPTPVGSSQNNFIQSSQAFFVITNTPGAAFVQVAETNKATTNNTQIFGRPVGTSPSFITNLLLLNPADNSTIEADGTRADFNPAFSAGIDDNDNLKCYNVNETFSFLRDAVLLATERRPAITNKDTLFFTLSRSTRRNYRFQFVAADFDDPSLTAMLEDSYTNLPIQLNSSGTTVVDFVINADAGSQVANRFRVVFNKSSLLPVTFSVVNAYRQNDNIEVSWKVDNEINTRQYEVERSADGRSFGKVHTTAATGNNLLSIGYDWVDTHAMQGDNFYRVKSIGLDGKAGFSRVVKVRIDQHDPAISVYPNPVADKVISLRFNHQSSGSYTLTLSNPAGQLLMEKTLDHAGGNDTKNIRLPASVQTGNYQLSVTGKDLNKTSLKVFVQ
ncbi:MAG: IPT/TIG domain-containing protein [Ferruginibacter sp.]|nr:IPT/TIG domain-containing protein [Ferruginibacter sp.]